MILDRSHKNWVVVVGGLAAVSALVYVLFPPAGLGTYGGTLTGLVFGSVSLAIMIFAALLGARRKRPALRVGRGTTWMKGHIWLSFLLVVLVPLHSGFRMGGNLTTLIWVLFILVTVSGLVGLALQQFLPKIMTESVTLETIYDQIGFITSQLCYEADGLVTGLCGPLGVESIPPEGTKPAKLKEGLPSPDGEKLKKFYLEMLRPGLVKGGKLLPLFKTAAKIESTYSQFKLLLPTSFHGVLNRLEAITEERRQFDRQRVLHWCLHGWIWVHAPASMALLALVIVHAFVALWY